MTYKVDNNSETLVEALVRGISQELSSYGKRVVYSSETLVEASVRGISQELCSCGRRTY